MTELLYLKDCYLKEFDATVVESGDGWVILDRTAFYTESGGQEWDEGWLQYDGKKIRVKEVKKKEGNSVHYTDGNIPQGSKVHGIVDWERRHKQMRMHTSQHLLAAVVARNYKATCVGNQIHTDKTRIDFHPVLFKDDDLRKIESECNALITKEIPVAIEFIPREIAEKRTAPGRVNWEKYPPQLKELRMINIHGIDYDPCGGTHIKNLKEIGKIRIIDKENKGKDKQRIIYELLD